MAASHNPAGTRIFHIRIFHKSLREVHATFMPGPIDYYQRLGSAIPLKAHLTKLNTLYRKRPGRFVGVI